MADNILSVGDASPLTTRGFSEQRLRQSAARVLDRKEDLWFLMDYMRAIYIEAWMSTAPDDVSAREAAFHKQQLLEELRNIVNNFASLHSKGQQDFMSHLMRDHTDKHNR